MYYINTQDQLENLGNYCAIIKLIKMNGVSDVSIFFYIFPSLYWIDDCNI